jgi:hypothetical protein
MAMKKRSLLRIEQLEARETPDVSLSQAALPSPEPLPAKSSSDGDSGLQAPTPTLLPAAAEAIDFASASLQVRDTLFFNPKEVDRLLGSAGSVSQSFPSPELQPEAAAEGLQFLCNYTRKAILNEELRYGILPDHEDMIQQVFIDWREQVGPDQTAFRNLLEKESAERLVLRKAVRRVIDHVRYETNRQKQMTELLDEPAPSSPAQQEWTDLQLDLASGLGNLSPRETQLLELRRQGKTFEEIGLELGLLKQRAFEIYDSTILRLQQIYA